jgi:hypothetical protein
MTIDHHRANGDAQVPQRSSNQPVPGAQSGPARPQCKSTNDSPDAQWDSWKPVRDLA